MKKIISFILVLTGLLTFSACYYDKANLLYPASALTVCDTAGAISYTQKVVPILQNTCYSCHTATAASGGIPMSSYAADKVLALNGKLYGSIAHASGFSPMPKSANALTSCQIATIKKWIDAGSPNN